jgi:16S rRNA (cytosine967-C5)-methyltransferase
VIRRAGDNARLAALQILSGVLDRGFNLSDAADSPAAESLPADLRDRAFALHLAYGVLRWLSALEWIADQLLQRPLKRKDGDIRRLILVGLFQLWHDSRGAHAAVHESAECARLLGKEWAVGLINAVLRRFQREREEWLSRVEQSDAGLAHPGWLLDRLREDWPEEWPAIVRANNEAAPLWLRLRRDRDAGAVRLGLEERGFTVEDHAVVPTAARLTPAAAVDRIPGFAEGMASVQDPAAQLAAGLLDLQAGLRVLDACAAPGGKTGHILETAPHVTLTALDRNPQRLEQVAGNLDRLGFRDHPGLSLLTADATDPDAWWDGEPYQRILLDVPCTATGIIRRHPEIKWLRTPEQLTEAVAIQALLLERLWPLLDTGGILLYATCSVLKDENCRQIDHFRQQHPDAEVSALDVPWGRPSGAGRQILPGELEMDGFYYARLLRT